ncbi:MAG: pseudouridine synthase [Pseudanabaenaceae cyanobacterium bins.39]|nr:pseudouridine synthase [Pseudanabaenaceae cyanobacterium bins.39]
MTSSTHGENQEVLRILATSAMILAEDGDRDGIEQIDYWIDYWYEGICPFSGERLRLPRTKQAEAIAQQLMQELVTGVYPEADLEEGKMYGVLIAEPWHQSGTSHQPIVLKAFSGLLRGRANWEGWVPPIDGREQVAIAESLVLEELAQIKAKLIALSEIPERREYEKRSLDYEQQLQVLSEMHQLAKQQRQIQRSQLMATLAGDALTQALQLLDQQSQREKMQRRNLKRDRDGVLQPLKEAIATADQQMQILKQQRRHKSRNLQAQMHQAFVLTNLAGEKRSLRELISTGAMPTGTGDCCAPKLLHYAATHHLKPLAMAEFWWGRSSEHKISGQFYGACAERCQPLMGFLLSHHRSEQPLIPTIKPQGDLSIIYEDAYLIAIAKPADLLSVPGRYLDTQDCALTRLKYYIQQTTNTNTSLHAVHRLDRQTSGILLFARDLDTLRHLQRQFQQRTIRKVYEAILSGRLDRDRGIIDLPLWGNPENRPRQQVDYERGKPSRTEFRLLGHKNNHAHIEFIPHTGRTHQIRVHAADPQGLGVPILGDRLYGCQQPSDRLYLHAKELSFIHPHSLKTIHLYQAMDII